MISEQIRERVKSLSLTQVQIADATGLSQSIVSEFLRGADCRVSTLDKLAALAGVELKKRSSPKT